MDVPNVFTNAFPIRDGEERVATTVGYMDKCWRQLLNWGAYDLDILDVVWCVYIILDVDGYPAIIAIKYYYEPTSTWHAAQLDSSSTTVGALRVAIFKQRFRS